MFIKKGIFLLLLISFSTTLYAWGGGEKLSDGSCKFDLETGYIESSLYIKKNESFLIMDGGDSKYGTISTVYNALTCKEIASGEKYKSDFDGLMKKKGFERIVLSSNTMDKSFRNIINFSKSDDNIKVNIKHIDNSTSRELVSLLKSLSDKSASSQINISNSTQKLLSNKRFYKKYLYQIDTLKDENINYGYALALNTLLKNDSKIESTILNKFFNLNVKSIKNVPQWVDNMSQFGKQNKISYFISKIMKLSDFGKKLNLNNFFTSIEYKYVLKDLKLKVRKIKNYDKEYGILLEYPNKDIRLIQKPTCTSTGKTTESEFSCGFLWSNTCIGTYQDYDCSGDTSKITYIERKLRGTTKVATALDKGWSYNTMISRRTKPSSSSASNYCNYINNRDMQNSCYAQTGKGQNYCNYINNRDMQNSCYAQTGKGQNYCNYINNRDMQNSCYAQTGKGQNYCNYINNRDIQNFCYAQTGKGQNYCNYINNFSSRQKLIFD